MKNRILALLILLNLAVLPKLFSQNVSINSTGNLPDTSAMLDVSSTTKGFLMPKMTTLQRNAIVLPATGLAIFNTTINGFQVNTGIPTAPVWSTLNAAAGSVSSVSVTTVNGISGTVATPTTTPAISLTLGNITPTSVVATGNLAGANLSGTNTGDETLATIKTKLGITTLSGSNTGDQTITLTGPVTGSGTGSFGTTITNNAVTYAKIQAVSATGKLLGSSSSSTPVQEISVGSGLSLSGTTLSATGSGGTVTSASVVTANGFAGTVATPTTTPAITLTTTVSGMVKGTGTILTSASPGSDYSLGTALNATGIVKSATGTGALTTAVAADFPLLNQNTTGNAGTVTTNANLTGPVTSVGNATTIAAAAVTNTNLANMPANTIKGNNTGSTTAPLDLTAAQVNAILPTFTATLNGLVPLSGGTSNFLRADGTWQPLSATNWGLTGNTATNSGINFLGTTDNTSLRFKTNGIQRIIADSLGSVGIGTSPAFTSGIYREKFLVDAGVTTSYNPMVVQGSIDSFFQFNIQNLSTGTHASSDIVATSNNGTQTSNYVDLGINGSNNSSNIFGKSNDAYLYNQGENFFIAASTPAKSLIFMTGGTDSATNEQMRINGSGNIGIGNPAPSQKLDVTGNVKFSGALMPNNLSGTAGSFLTSNGPGASPTWSSAISGINTGDVTIGTANGLSLTGQALSLGLASGSTTGALSATDWTTFNNKLTTIDTTNIPSFYLKVRGLLSAGTGISYNNSTGTISNTGVTSLNGATGNITIPIGNLTETGSSVLTITGGTGAVMGTGSALQVKQASGIQSGFLSSADWTTFNNKAGATSGWSVTGNTATNSGINFLGTSDNASLKFRTNNIQQMKIDSTGNVAIGQDVFDATNPEKLVVNAGITSSVNAFLAKGSINNYFQMNIKNSSNGANATSDIVATADNGTESTNYVDLGINGSGYTGSAIQTGVANDGYLISSGNDFYMVNNSANRNMLFLTGGSGVANERMRILANGRVGMGVQDPTAPFVVKDTMEIRRVGSLSQLLFTKTAGSGDFRIGGDGGDIYWQGGGGRGLQMGSYWTTILSGDRQTTTYPAFTNTPSGIGVLVLGAQDASVPLAIQAYSGTQSAALTQWRNSAGTVLSAVNKDGYLGLGNSSPSEKLDVTGNVKFSGALMPNNLPGAVGNVLTSNGGGAAPTWSTAITGTNTGDVTIGTANGLSLSGQILSLGLSGASSTGALSTTDWVTFNNKANTANVWSLTGNTGTSASTNYIGTSDATDLVFKTNNTERLRIVNGVSASSGTTGDLTIGDANSGTIRSNKEFVMREDGDLYGPSVLRLRNRTGENGAIFETIGTSANLVDFIFKTGTVATPIVSNLRFETRTASEYVSGNTTEWQVGQPGNPTMIISAASSGNSALRIGNFGINNINPTEKLDVAGNIKFTGALMPNNTAGTSGYFLLSNGPGLSPTWSPVVTNANLTGMVTSVGNATTVVTNANLTGEVTSVGNTATLLNGAVIGKTLTGYVSGAGTITAADNILQAIQKLNGNSATNANLNGMVTSVGNTTTVVTNANLTGEVTSAGNAATVSNTAVIGKVLTGYVSGAGVIAPTDNILQAIQKLNGNSATNANLTGMVTSVGNATTVVTNANLTGGVTSVGNATTVVTNANLTGEVTSAGNAATVSNTAVIGKVLTGYVSGAGVIAPTDNILQAIQKLNGNSATNANLTGMVTSVGNATTVVTNANLTGEVTSAGNAATVSNTAVIGKVLTGYVSGAGVIAPTDNILQAIQKLNGNSATNANLTGMVTSVGNATTVVTNANLTGPVTSSGNATTIIAGAVINTMLANMAINTIKGTVVAGVPADLSGTQVNTILPVFTSALKGLVPSGGTAGQILHGDGTWKDTASTTNKWSTTGNTGTSYLTNYIGTTDNNGFRVKVNTAAAGGFQGLLVDSLGNVAVGNTPLFTASPNREKLLVDAGTNAANDFVNVVSGKGSTNNYLQVNIQNRSNGAAASSDIVATNNTGTESVNYIDMGINSTGFAAGTMTGGANTAYLFATGNDFVIGNNTANKPLRFYTTTPAAVNVEAMRIDSGGNVGIGTTTPTTALHVVKNNPGGGILLLQNSSATGFSSADFLDNTGALSGTFGYANAGSGGLFGGRDYFNSYGKDFLWTANSTTAALFVKANSNVGIGTTAPATALHVYGTNPLTLTGVQLGTTTTADSLLTINSGTVQKLPMSTFVSTANTWSTGGNSIVPSGTSYLGTNYNQSLKFKTNSIEGMILDSLGSVGIGTAPAFTAGTFHEKFLVDAGASGTANYQNVITGKGNTNSYAQLNIQNINAGTGASSDVVATADNGSESTNFIDMGINSSTNNSGVMGVKNDAYLYNVGQNLFIGTATATKSLIFMTGGTDSATNEQMRIDGNGRVGIGNPAPSQILDVTGNVKFSGALMPAGATGNAGDFLISTGGGAPTWFNATPFVNTVAWVRTGNAGTTSTTDFIGTTDLKSLKFKTNSVQGMLLDSSGSVGIGLNPAFTAGAPHEKFLVDAGTSTTSYNVISGKGNIDNYLQLNIQNRAATGAASSDVVASNDAATETANFIDMGINSSANTSTGVLGGFNTGYLYSTGSDFSIGNATSGKALQFFTGGTASGNERIHIKSDGNIGIGTSTPNSLFEINGAMATALSKPTGTAAITLDNTATVWYFTTTVASINFPVAATCTNRVYTIVNRSGGSRITSSYTGFTGAAAALANNSSMDIISDGTTWLQIR